MPIVYSKVNKTVLNRRTMIIIHFIDLFDRNTFKLFRCNIIDYSFIIFERLIRSIIIFLRAILINIYLRLCQTSSQTRDLRTYRLLQLRSNYNVRTECDYLMICFLHRTFFIFFNIVSWYVNIGVTGRYLRITMNNIFFFFYCKILLKIPDKYFEFWISS